MTQLSLLLSWIGYELPDAEIKLLPGFMSDLEATDLHRSLVASIPWRQDTISLYGRVHPLPRLQQWFGDSGLRYTWSGIALQPQPWTTELDRMRQKIEATTGSTFNTVLANLYRTGNDTVSWHSDDEPELGTDPVIASVSLGAERDFVLRHKSQELSQTISLPHGSLLLMSGTTQTSWKHSLPVRKGAGERLNLTFRRIIR